MGWKMENGISCRCRGFFLSVQVQDERYENEFLFQYDIDAVNGGDNHTVQRTRYNM